MDGKAGNIRGLLLGLVVDLLLVGSAHALEVGEKASEFTLMAPGR